MIHKAFTLIELVVVVALIMILSAIGIGAFTTSTIKSRDTQRKNDLNQISKAIESFNNDVGRYPNSNESNQVVCYQIVSGIGSDVPCVSDKLIFRLDGAVTTYTQIPSDPDLGQRYSYQSNESGFSLYAALQNMNDKDLLFDEAGVVLSDPYGVTCGNTPCNYRITEVGLTKEL